MRITRLLPTSRVARATISLAVLASLVAISVIVSGATGNSSGDDPLTRDAQAYADRHNTTLDEAIIRLNLQEVVGDLEYQLASNEGATFAGIWIQHSPEYKIVVKFTENGDATMRRYVEDGELEGLIEVGRATNTLASLEEAQTNAKTLGATVNVKTESDIDIFNNKVTLHVLDKTDFVDKVEEDGLTIPSTVRVVEVPEFSRTEADIYGGLSLSICTSGFAVSSNVGDVGDLGITTAAHCEGDLQYNGSDLDSVESVEAGFLDLRWFTTPGYTPVNRIKDGSGGRSITGTTHRNNQSIGTTVCKYGITTHFTCGELISKWLQPSGHYHATFMRVHNPDADDLSAGGDSGGPWFVDSDAYGTHHGSIPHVDDFGTTAIDDAIYMAVNYFANMDIEVLTD